MTRILAIETSCDETSTTVAQNGLALDPRTVMASDEKTLPGVVTGKTVV